MSFAVLHLLFSALVVSSLGQARMMGDEVTIPSALARIFPNHSVKWSKWGNHLASLDIEVVGDVRLITPSVWASIRMSPVLKSGLSILRSSSDQSAGTEMGTDKSPAPQPPNAQPPNVDDPVLEAALNIQAKYNVVMIVYMSYGFLDMTKNWLCNVADLTSSIGSIADGTLFIVTDQLSKTALLEFMPNLVVVVAGHTVDEFGNAKNVDVQAVLDYASPGYLDLMRWRTHEIEVFLLNDISIFVIETDAVWFDHDPRLDLIRSRKDIMTANDHGHKPGARLVSPGFMFMKPTDPVRRLWKDVIRVTAESGNDAYALQDILLNPPADIDFGFLPRSLYANGGWFRTKSYRRHANHPMVIQNNWVRGKAAKIARAKDWNFWYLSEDEKTCTYTGTQFDPVNPAPIIPAKYA